MANGALQVLQFLMSPERVWWVAGAVVFFVIVAMVLAYWLISRGQSIKLGSFFDWTSKP